MWSVNRPSMPSDEGLVFVIRGGRFFFSEFFDHVRMCLEMVAHQVSGSPSGRRKPRLSDTDFACTHYTLALGGGPCREVVVDIGKFSIFARYYGISGDAVDVSSCLQVLQKIGSPFSPMRVAVNAVAVVAASMHCLVHLKSKVLVRLSSPGEPQGGGISVV